MPPQTSPLAVLLIALVVAALSLLTFFFWRWAVRQPAPVAQIAPGGTMTPAVEAEPKTYVAIGASDVVGVGADDPASQSWVNILHGMMQPDTRMTRLARSGITLREALEVEVPRAVASRPDVVTMWLSVNDVGRGVALSDYQTDLAKALSTLTRDTDATIYLLNVPDLSIILSSYGDEQQRSMIQGGVKQWNAAIAATAARFGGRVKVVDIYPISAEVLERPDYLSADGFHPSTKGYRRLAEVVWEAMGEGEDFQS